MQNLSYNIKYSVVPISSSLRTPSLVPMTHIYNGKKLFILILNVTIELD